ncbi:GNAT family N-acetyltransferase [Streptomyces sp. NPDC015131]|uniref:GNAT family N-acetyltransferase n=1 Tax=Streptomyces sp. NPDC015131 TaxID=3364941 RepID=UPI0037034BA0
MDVVLREVRESDLPVFFSHMSDPESSRMAAFTAEDPTDRAGFDAHWARVLASDAVVRTVLADGEVVGHTAVYGPPDEREVTYVVGRTHWGRGIATAALRALLGLVDTRPLHARAAADNKGSIRVLEKCGFTVTGRARGFAHARGEETDEVLLRLDG